MFIDRDTRPPPAPFEEAEVKERFTTPAPFRFFERSCFPFYASFYKHCTPIGVNRFYTYLTRYCLHRLGSWPEV